MTQKREGVNRLEQLQADEKIENILIEIFSNKNEITSADKETAHDARESSSLSQIKKLLEKYEDEKYARPFYEGYKKKMKVGERNLTVVYVKYNQDEQALPAASLDAASQAAIQIRKLNLVAAVLNALSISEDYLKIKNKEIFERELMALLEESLKKNIKKEPALQVNSFIKEMTQLIKIHTGEDRESITRKIRNAERYFVAENNVDKMLIFENKFKGSSYYQVDVPYDVNSELTEPQKNHLLAVRSEQPPDWFSVLPKWEQDCILKLIPASLDGNWHQFSQSSAMQHMPGMKNARYNYLLEDENNSGKDPQIISKSIKMSTLVPYEMPEHEQREHTHAAVNQALNGLNVLAKENFKNKWGDIFEKQAIEVKPLVLLQQLLSDTTFGADDNHLSKMQNTQIKEAQSRFNEIEIVADTEPVNILRVMALQNKDRWIYANQVLNYTEKFQMAIKQCQLNGVQFNKKQTASIALIEHAKAELEKLQNPQLLEHLQMTLGLRNFEAFKVAYLAILTEAMGGAVSTNCKSGKDRTGLDEIYRASMMLYFKEKGVLPSFTDKGAERQNFINIFTQLFNTMKTQEAAAANTPGSFGLKDDAKMLCADIAAALGDSYRYSNDNARMNKPGIFMHDEEVQKNEMLKKENDLYSVAMLAAKYLTAPGLIYTAVQTLAPLVMKASSTITKVSPVAAKELNKQMGGMFASIRSQFKSEKASNDKKNDESGKGKNMRR